MAQQSPINSFRDSKVWELGMELTEQVYLLTKQFPKEELYGLTIQLRRAAASVPANIAEGARSGWDEGVPAIFIDICRFTCGS